ncbi:hypothetical protein [Pedobacter sp. L105]|uniref:hypothetical protein n=1 Tax=Pedobacter sp. L105 TaxID=1641871 RepID=UPI00131AABEE|nr:hypothetical protein [Pedobacter sp. L105]
MKGDKMKTIIKKVSIINGFGKGIVDKTMKSFDNDPVMIRKANEALELLKRVGLPSKQLVNQLS